MTTDITKTINFWTVENTGWSGGISWFSTGGTDANPLRFKTKYEAINYLIKQKEELNQDTTLWRYVHTTIQRTDNKEVITRTFTIC